MSLIQRQQFNPATGQYESVFVDTDTGQAVGSYGSQPNQGTASPLTGQGAPPLTGPTESVPFGFQGGAGIQAGPGAGPDLSVPSQPGPMQGPQNNFASRHPRANQVLQNLGPALSAMNMQPIEPTPYPVSGFAQFARSLSQAGQTYIGAGENIQKARTQRAVKKGGEAGLQAVEAGKPLAQMTPEERYSMQLAGLPEPKTTLSGKESAELERAPFRLEKRQQDEMDLQKRQIDAQIDHNESLLRLQKDEAKTAADGVKQRLQESRADFVREIGATNAAQYSAAVKLFNHMYLGQDIPESLNKDLEGLASPQLIRAQASAAAAQVRGNQLMGQITELVNKRTDLDEKQKLDVLLAIRRIDTITSNPNIFMYNPSAQSEYEDALKTIESILPEAKTITKSEKAWYKKAWAAVQSGLGIGEGAAAGVVPDAERAEYEALVAEAQAAGGRLPPDKAARIQELAKRFRQAQ